MLKFCWEAQFIQILYAFKNEIRRNLIILIFSGFRKYIYDYHGKLFLRSMVILVLHVSHKCIMVKREVSNTKLIVLHKGVIPSLEVYIYMTYWTVTMVSINVSMYSRDVTL